MTNPETNFKQMLFSGQFAAQVQEVVKGETIKSPEELLNILSPLLCGKDSDVEKGCFLFLDAKNRIIHIEISFSGSISNCAIYPREVVKKCLQYKAAALIMAHNHPSGDLTPSESDFDITARVIAACKVIGVEVHDHVIITENAFYSMEAYDSFVSKVKRKVEKFFDLEI
jgi:DNA repair protein RadC